MIEQDWANEKPRKWFSTPYNFAEKVVYLKDLVFGPAASNRHLTSFIPQTVTLNNITDRMKLAFVGDILPTGKIPLTITDEVADFISDADFLIANFEGTISNEKKVFMAQSHSKEIISLLAKLFPPEKTVLALANNHGADFGWNEFSKSCELLKAHGFSVIGTRPQPSILLNDQVNVASLTKWSNQPCPYLANFDDSNKAFAPKARFNILFPHWGYENQLYPTPEGIESGQRLLASWDMIVAHHPHCPQPVTAYEINTHRRLLAYSLGDFITGVRMSQYRWGIVLKATIGPDSTGSWQVGHVEWKFTNVKSVGKSENKVELSTDCPYFQL